VAGRRAGIGPRNAETGNQRSRSVGKDGALCYPAGVGWPRRARHAHRARGDRHHDRRPDDGGRHDDRGARRWV